METAELRKKKISELSLDVADLRKEQWKLKMAGRTGQSLRYDQFRKLRRDIARIYTVITEKQNQEQQDESHE